MFSSSTTLLRRSGLDKELHDELQRTLNAISRSDAQTLDATSLEDRVSEATRTPPTVLRAEASLSVNAQGTSLAATLTIPISGNVSLLEFDPTGRPSAPTRQNTLHGQLTDNLAWAQDRSATGYSYESREVEEPSPGGFTITRVFPSDTETDVIDRWAKSIVDRIDQGSQTLRQRIEGHNARLPRDLEDAIQRRRQALERSDELNAHFKQGF